MAWALLAVSSEGQADTLAHQREWAESTAVEKGWTLVRALGDEGEGVGTGKHGPRRIVVRLLTDLRALPPEARPQWLLVIRADRFGRGEDIVENQLILRDLKRLGVRVWARLGGEKKVDTIYEQLASAMEAAQAASENEVRRDKALNFYKRRRAAGAVLSNKRPYGLLWTPTGDRVVPEEARAVKLAFDLRAAGEGYFVICRRLQEMAVPRRLVDGTERVIHWQEGRVGRMLQHRAYIGTIVDEVTFARAELVRQQNTRVIPRETVYPWPLAGAVRCWCGNMLNGRTSGKFGKGKRIRYYGCRQVSYHLDGMHSVRADDLEEQFTALLRGFSADPAAIYRAGDMAASPALIDRSLKIARDELAGIARQTAAVWELHAAGHVRDEDLQARLDVIGSRGGELEDTVADLEQRRALAAAVRVDERNAAEILKKADRAWRSPRTTVAARQAVARALALRIGGLYIDEDDRLCVGSTRSELARRRGLRA